jgi:predicted  nucleic acid-binding Zn-ribbon protein
MKTLKTSLLLAGLLTVSASFAQGGSTMSREQKNAAEQSIEAQAKADKKACDSMSGNAKDVCQAEAKAKEKTAKAELDFRASGSDRDRAKAMQVKAEGEYEVAKERCEDQKGDAQDACKDRAKAQHQQSRAHTRQGQGMPASKY